MSCVGRMQSCENCKRLSKCLGFENCTLRLYARFMESFTSLMARTGTPAAGEACTGTTPMRLRTTSLGDAK